MSMSSLSPLWLAGRSALIAQNSRRDSVVEFHLLNEADVGAATLKSESLFMLPYRKAACILLQNPLCLPTLLLLLLLRHGAKS